MRTFRLVIACPDRVGIVAKVRKSLRDTSLRAKCIFKSNEIFEIKH